VKWEGYKGLVDKIKPDVIALAGDLTSDGCADFWSGAVQQIPEFQKEKKQLMKKFGFNERSSKLSSLETKYQETREFRKIRKKIHVDKFYNFLMYAGKKSKVLIVKGNHDEDFEGDYVSEKINRISGCKEISGKIIDIKGFHFLGLGFNETHYLRVLKPIIEKFKGNVDVVIAHCEQNRTPLLSLLKPKIIIRGHSGIGKYLVSDTPSAFTGGVICTIIKLEKTPKILQYDWNNKTEILQKSSLRP
jgi:hypothetical protein